MSIVGVEWVFNLEKAPWRGGVIERMNLPDHLTYHEEDGDEEFEITDEALQRRAKHLSVVLYHFWKQWSKESLLELRDAHRQKRTTSTSANIRVGDVVLVHDQDHP